MEEGAVDRHKRAAQKLEFAQQKHKFPVRRLERRPVLSAEFGDRPITRCQPLQKPHQFQIALRLLFEPTRRANPMKVAIKIGFQQIRWMIARLASPETATGMPESEFLKIERADIGLDSPHRIVRPDIILNTSRQKAQLLTALAGLIE